MKGPPSSLKTLCDRIAAASVSAEGAQLARLLRMAMQSTSASVSPPASRQ
jgi:hypothetical protein